jgi:tetratricopeptide (TPR) repeat protein
MNQIAGQGNAGFMPIGEALIYADRCRNDGRIMEAEAVCRQILEAQPNRPEAEHLLGVIAHQNGKLGEAVEHVQRAVQFAPNVALFHANLGEMLRLAGRPRLAIASARRAIELDPKMAMALSNLGVALFEVKDYEEAARAQRRAIAANPNFAEAHCNLGNALQAIRQRDEAVASYRRALELKPDYADAWANLGTTLHHNGHFEEAIAILRRAIALAPHHANAHSGLGILLLMRGELGEGWDEYEWRLRSTERTGPKFPEAPWRGDSLAGKHIYVQAEQGFGDTLQFARYIPWLAPATRDADAREPARHRGLRRSRHRRALSMRRRAFEPAAAVPHPPRNHSGRHALSARASGGGAALERAACWLKGPQGRSGLGRQSGACQR